jgi:hypothetical protein
MTMTTTPCELAFLKGVKIYACRSVPYVARPCLVEVERPVGNWLERASRPRSCRTKIFHDLTDTDAFKVFISRHSSKFMTN